MLEEGLRDRESHQDNVASLQTFVPLELTDSLQDYQARALELRAAGTADVVITNLPERLSKEFLAQVEKIYTDFDGTILDPGETVISERTQEDIARLSELGVEITGVTGKPYMEIEKLVNNLPDNFPLGIIFEKGAFVLRRDDDGNLESKTLLATEGAVKSTSEVKSLFRESWKKEIEELLPVRLELAGTGTHECVFSMDILDPALAPEGDAFMSVEGGRDSIKIHDSELIAQVKEILCEKIQEVEGFENSAAVDLGNSNIEWAPDDTNCTIEKDLGVAAHAGFTVSEDSETGQVKIIPNDSKIAMLGDSGNDRALYSLAKEFDNMAGCLVFHERTPVDMIEHTDFLTTGCANAAAFFELVIEAKEGRL